MKRLRIVTVVLSEDTPVPSVGVIATGLSECWANDPNLEQYFEPIE